MRRLLQRLLALVRREPARFDGYTARFAMPIERRLLIVTSPHRLTREQREACLKFLRESAPRWDIVILDPGFTAHEIGRLGDEA